MRLVGRREGYLLITMVTYLLPLGSVPVTSSWSRTSPGTPVGNPSQFSTKEHSVINAGKFTKNA